MKENPHFLATMTATFDTEDLASYYRPHHHDHPHIVVHHDRSEQQSVDDSEVPAIAAAPGAAASTTTESDTSSNSTATTTTELVCVGVARTKKKAEAMAAADIMALLYDSMGINCRNPPALKEKRLKAAQERSQAAFKTELARAQMILEMINCSRPVFTTEEGSEKVEGKEKGTDDEAEKEE